MNTTQKRFFSKPRGMDEIMNDLFKGDAFAANHFQNKHINSGELEVINTKEKHGDSFISKLKIALKKDKPLREIMVYYKNGGKDNAPFCTTVNMAAHLTDKEMLDYFAPGAVFNVGAGEFDLMAEVERAEIIK